MNMMNMNGAFSTMQLHDYYGNETGIMPSLRQRIPGSAEQADLRMQSHLQFPINIKTEAMDMMPSQTSPLMPLGLTHLNHHGMPPMTSSPGSMHLNAPMDTCPTMLGSAIPMETNEILNKAGRARKQKEDKYCGVCGDRALGYNFDAISCESCKAFFRRNALKGLDYFKCPYDEKCKMDISNRRFCKRCRLKKCFEIGMRKEYILTEEEKMKKRQKIDENRSRSPWDGPGSTQSQPPRKMAANGLETNCRSSANTCTIDVDSEPREVILERKNGTLSPKTQNAEVTSSQPRRQLLAEEESMIEEIKAAYKSSLEVSIEGPPRDQSSCMADLVNIAELSVRRVIDMSKKIKSFKSLSQADQISLLKGGSIELLILRSVISYDKDKQQFLDESDMDSNTMTTEQLKNAEGGLFEDHMKFVRSLAVDLKADETMLILLLVVSLFSPDRPNLLDKSKVCAEQERYSILLNHYLESKLPYGQARSVYPKLLMKLVDIRNLNEEHSAILVKVNPEGIQPLMIELLDLRT
ncbi:nuclear hormone receptor HR96-like isoform X2 [Lineus longissimus]|uniref:nuclear hormone receptor HR96-like isoform X2 n=1 Tax=Lineus longissimus TaxID=88925 RepID=UPI002B4E0C95